MVLETFARQRPTSAAEIARLCDINRAVAHWLLVSLSQRAYVRSGEYGYHLTKLGCTDVASSAVARPGMRQASSGQLRSHANVTSLIKYSTQF